MEDTLKASTDRVESVVLDDGKERTHARLVAMAGQPLDRDQRRDGSYDADLLETGGGNDTIVALGGNDTLEGGSGHDSLIGGLGNDVYRFDPGFGHDTISDNGVNFQSASDQVVFGAGLERADLRVEADGSDLILSFAGEDGSLRLQFSLTSASYRIETVVFEDGTELSHADLVTLALVGAPADQRMEASYDAETLSGGGGNDSLFGLGGDDTITGGTGNDFLQGGVGNDRYVFEAGFGQDTISDNGVNFQSAADVVAFGAGLSLDDLQVRAIGNDIELRFGGEDRLLIQFGLESASYLIETFLFDDGRSLTRAEMLERLTTGTAGADDLTGLGGADSIEALQGDDTLRGNSGDDTLVSGEGDDWASGGNGNDLIRGDDGDDSLFGDSGNDTLEGGAGFDVFEGGFGRDSLEGGAGNDTLQGDDDADTLVGGAGDDLLIGGARDDTYRFGAGFGHDVIDERIGSAFRSGTDVVLFDATIAAADVSVFIDGDDLILSVAGGDRLRIAGTVSGGEKRVESVSFEAEAITWSHADLIAAAQPWPGAEGLAQQGSPLTNVIQGGAGDDTLNGLSSTASEMLGAGGNDTLTGGRAGETLEGGTGNDLLLGMGGDDIYRFARG